MHAHRITLCTNIWWYGHPLQWHQSMYMLEVCFCIYHNMCPIDSHVQLIHCWADGDVQRIPNHFTIIMIRMRFENHVCLQLNWFSFTWLAGFVRSTCPMRILGIYILVGSRERSTTCNIIINNHWKMCMDATIIYSHVMQNVVSAKL